MKATFALYPLLLVLMFGCATMESSCENITTASEQIKDCQVLQRQMTNAKDRPLIRTELERRYQVNCVDIRYYRDDKQEAMCGNKHKVSGENKARKTKSQ